MPSTTDQRRRHKRQARQRAAVAATVFAGVLTLAACGGDKDSAKAAATPSTAKGAASKVAAVSRDPTAAAKDKVAAAFQGLVDVETAGFAKATFEGTDIEQYASGQVLADDKRTLLINRANDVVTKGKPAFTVRQGPSRRCRRLPEAATQAACPERSAHSSAGPRRRTPRYYPSHAGSAPRRAPRPDAAPRQPSPSADHSWQGTAPVTSAATVKHTGAAARRYSPIAWRRSPIGACGGRHLRKVGEDGTRMAVQRQRGAGAITDQVSSGVSSNSQLIITLANASRLGRALPARHPRWRASEGPRYRADLPNGPLRVPGGPVLNDAGPYCPPLPRFRTVGTSSRPARIGQRATTHETSGPDCNALSTRFPRRCQVPLSA